MYDEKEKPNRHLDNLKYKYIHGFRKNKYPADGFYYCRDQALPWCVYYAYNGHYFEKMMPALRYAAYRKFITMDMIDIIRIRLEEGGYTDE